MCRCVSVHHHPTLHRMHSTRSCNQHAWFVVPRHTLCHRVCFYPRNAPLGCCHASTCNTCFNTHARSPAARCPCTVWCPAAAAAPGQTSAQLAPPARLGTRRPSALCSSQQNIMYYACGRCRAMCLVLVQTRRAVCAAVVGPAQLGTRRPSALCSSQQQRVATGGAFGACKQCSVLLMMCPISLAWNKPKAAAVWCLAWLGAHCVVLLHRAVVACTVAGTCQAKHLFGVCKRQRR